MSSATDTITSQLTQSNSSSVNMSSCAMFGLRFILWSFVFLCLLCVLSSMLSQSFARIEEKRYYDTLSYRHPIMLRKHQGCQPLIEEIDNVDEYLAYSNTDIFKAQMISLTSPLQTKTNELSNLMFGQALRHIIIHNKEQKIIYNISANLYVIEGNVYEQATDKLKQSYYVQLVDDNNNIIDLGELKRDNDGMYKLLVESKDVSKFQNYDNMQIIYQKGDDKQIILIGNFK